VNVLCIIPARGGSKQIPGKNLVPIAEKPLLAYSIEHANASSMVSKIVVSTDDAEIGTLAKAYGIEVVWRPAEFATDEATSESALLHALDFVEQRGFTADLVVFLQCTSPVRRDDDIDNAIRTLLDEEADSLFSGTPFHWLIWRRSTDRLDPLNYDYLDRKRRQEMPEEIHENGSIYVFKPWVLRCFNNRLGGKAAVYRMAYWSSFQVDSYEDLALCEWIITNRPEAGSPAGF